MFWFRFRVQGSIVTWAFGMLTFVSTFYIQLQGD